MTDFLTESAIDLRLSGEHTPVPLQAISRLTAAVGLTLTSSRAPVVMDMACREGHLLEQIRLMSPDATLIGIDPWQDAVTAARRRLGPKAEICQMNGEAVRTERLPSLRRGLDLAVSCLSLCSTPRTLNTIASIIARLKIGGQLYLTDIVPPREVRDRSLLLSLAGNEESREELASMASAAIGAPELFGLLSDASLAAGRTTAIRISTGGLGGFPPGSPEAERVARDPRARAALEAVSGSREITDRVLMHAHLVRTH